MKFTLLLLFLLIFCVDTYSQEFDSTIYYKYVDAPSIQRVVYLKKYRNPNHLKFEGWAVYKDTPGYEFIELKLGIWKTYYKNGNLKYYYNYGEEILKRKDTIKSKTYNKNGLLIEDCSYVVKASTPPSTSKDIINVEGSNKDYIWSKYIYYDKHGKLLEGSYNSDGKKSGEWIEYKKGTPSKIKTYHDGNIIEIKKLK